MYKFNFITGLFALSMFSYAQYQGWNMFDNTAQATHSAGGGSSRIYHK